MSSENYWFVGASYGENSEDQTDRFIEKGSWENGYEDKYLEDVRSVKVGDSIAIKSAYTRKNGLPFEANGRTVSVMGIKAIGTVTKNHEDGRNLDVNWEERFDIPKEWFFFTNRSTIWCIQPSDWMRKALIDFTFNGSQQAYDKFRNAPFWAERFGDKVAKEDQFEWTQFYEEFATALLQYKDNRATLVQEIVNILERNGNLTTPTDKFKDGTSGVIQDICPFTAMGLFNRSITDANRVDVAKQLAAFLEIKTEVPSRFDGIPLLNNQKSWFYDYEKNRGPEDIDKLWDFFELALEYSDNQTISKETFIDKFDSVRKIKFVHWNLTMGLYWARPWAFATLDTNTRNYIKNKLSLDISSGKKRARCNGKDYLNILDRLTINFGRENYPCHSYPSLSLQSWGFGAESIAESWREKMLDSIEDLCQKLNSVEFSRQEFLDEYLEQFKQEFPKNKTVDSSINKQFQLLRDSDYLEFIDGERGHYRFLLDLDVEDFSSERHLGKSKYTVDSIIGEGCFLTKAQIDDMLSRLKLKKNMILQGPPGTGKTWLAKRLGYCLIGFNDDQDALKAVQFHPNLSYEDFVRGYRPTGEGKLALVDGPFMELVQKANNDQDTNYVIVVEEINRGNPAQIFGELLTLLEADKRTPKEGLELCYRKEDGEKVHIPPNLYVIGTMNVADRSLAMVDFALRRRFAFVGLQPLFNQAWIDFVSDKFDIDKALLKNLSHRIELLNSEITNDPSLGKQFVIGHSFFTPPMDSQVPDAQKWIEQTVDTEIQPLLEEYWYEDLDKVQRLCDGVKG